MQLYSIDHAFSLIEKGNFREALPILEDLQAQEPGNPRVAYGLGLAYLFYNQASLAVPHLKTAAKVAKKDAAVQTTTASALNLSGQNEDALAYARKGVALNPKSEYGNRVLGEIYSDLRRPVLARQSLDQALKANPNSARAHLGLFELDMTLGQTDAAEKHIRSAFKLTPSDPAILAAAANSEDDAFKAQVLEQISRLLASVPSGAASPDISRMAIAAGKICDAAGDLDKAFQYFDGYRTGLYRDYNPQQRQWYVETCRKVFTPAFFEERQDFALSSERPVFVVGMPRSGTTLVEQIIARHPDAIGAGELQVIPDQIHDMCGGQRHGPALFEAALKLSKKDAQRIGRRYLASLESLDKKSRRVVDKMPHNFENLWLLALLFPKASFVHVTRAPEDTCASIYMTPLPSNHLYCNSQTSLGHYYRQYQNLMDHWSEVLPVPMRHQSYEELTRSQEAESRALIDHVGLNWNDTCLSMPGPDTQVFTFSRAQVRQPVYQTAIDRWKRYEPHIAPLLAALKEADAEPVAG